MTAHPLVAQITRHRIERGITRAQVCKRTGYPEPSIVLWDAGIYTPRTDRALAYADAVGLLAVLRTGHECLRCGAHSTPSPGMPITDTQALIAELRRVRLTENLTQSQAAQRGGIAFRTVQKWEQGGLPMLPPLCDYMERLGCSLSLEPILTAARS